MVSIVMFDCHYPKYFNTKCDCIEWHYLITIMLSVVVLFSILLQLCWMTLCRVSWHQ